MQSYEKRQKRKKKSMSKKPSDGRIWPYAIVISILIIIAAAAATVVVAVKHPVEMSDMDMQDYHHYDRNANDIINAKIAFDRLYDLSYHSHSFNKENAVVAYALVDKEGNAIDNAKINIMVTRPGDHNNDMPFDKPSHIENGVYSFNICALPLEGRWNVLAEIIVDNNVRYFNLKVDTRNESAFEY